MLYTEQASRLTSHKSLESSARSKTFNQKIPSYQRAVIRICRSRGNLPSLLTARLGASAVTLQQAGWVHQGVLCLPPPRPAHSFTQVWQQGVYRLSPSAPHGLQSRAPRIPLPPRPPAGALCATPRPSARSNRTSARTFRARIPPSARQCFGSRVSSESIAGALCAAPAPASARKWKHAHAPAPRAAPAAGEGRGPTAGQ